VERKVRTQRTSADPSTMCWRDLGELQAWSDERVLPPPPLGRMGQRMLELAQEPVVHRSIDLYARLLEVAR
jgi:hypothetical protein